MRTRSRSTTTDTPWNLTSNEATMADFIQALDPSKLVIVGSVCLRRVYPMLPSFPISRLFVHLPLDHVVRDKRVFCASIQSSHLPVWSPCTRELGGDPVLAGCTWFIVIASCGRSPLPTHTPHGTQLQFTYLLAGSMLFDVIWMSRNSQHWLARLITVLLLILKVRTPHA